VSGVAETRERLLEATLACIERWGLAKTSLEDVAGEAGLSRATVYRYFPRGRDQVISETITWETGRFFTRLGEAVAEDADLASALEHALLLGHRAIVEHRLLQQVLRTEPEAFLAEFSDSTPLILGVVRDYVGSLLQRERLQPDVDPAVAADYLARLYLSYLGTSGRWDLGDPAVVAQLVRTQFLAGIIDPFPPDPPTHM
jgi:AcrR family transcriptional regulator